jgi:RNA polymerase subunit RPABC4/transcription elongation factor Spt4
MARRATMRIKTCSKCGTVSVPAQSFCPGCGERLPEVTHSDPAVRCPNCLSTQVAAAQQGFGAGKAVAGAILLGPIGLAAGFAGSAKVKLTSMKCGHAFQPGG